MKFSYYWYHFGMSYSTMESIEDAINDRNFNAFMKYKQKYPKNLPDTIAVFDDNYDIIDQLDVTDKNNFDKITYSEHENG